MDRKRLKQWARNAFCRSYWKGVLVSLLFYLVTFVTVYMISYGIAVLICFLVPGSISIIFAKVYAPSAEAHIISGMWGMIMLFIVGFSAVFITVGTGTKVFVGNALEVGCKKFLSKSLYKQNTGLGEMGEGFSKGYRRRMWVMFVRDLYLFLWSILCTVIYIVVGMGVLYGGMYMYRKLGYYEDSIEFVIFTFFLMLLVYAICIASFIPLYIKRLHYLCIPYILADDKDMPRKKVFELSKRMIYGDKWNVCVMHLSFIGWMILSALTFYILHIFYVGPYIEYTTAAYYEAFKQKVGFTGKSQNY